VGAVSDRTPRTATVTVRPPDGGGGLFTATARSFGGGNGVMFEQSYSTSEEADRRAAELRAFYRRSGYTVDGVAPTGPDPLATPERPAMPVPPPAPLLPVFVASAEAEPEPIHHTPESVWEKVT